MPLTSEQMERELEDTKARLKILEIMLARYNSNGLDVLLNQNLIGTTARQAKAGNL